MGMTRERRELQAINRACSDFSFSDTDDVPLSAIVRSALVTLKHAVEELEAEVTRLRAQLAATQEQKRDDDENDGNYILNSLVNRNGTLA